MPSWGLTRIFEILAVSARHCQTVFFPSWASASQISSLCDRWLKPVTLPMRWCSWRMRLELGSATLYGRISLNPLSSYICFAFAVQPFKLNSSLSKLRFSQVTKHLMQARDKIEAFGSEIVLSTPIPSALRELNFHRKKTNLLQMREEGFLHFLFCVWLAILDDVLCVLKAVEREFAQIMSEFAACAAPAILSFEIVNPPWRHQYAENEETAVTFKKVAR